MIHVYCLLISFVLVSFSSSLPIEEIEPFQALATTQETSTLPNNSTSYVYDDYPFSYSKMYDGFCAFMKRKFNIDFKEPKTKKNAKRFIAFLIFFYVFHKIIQYLTS
uniref:Uncharacterized protein n=1 Tax=Clastoptera arizonana TaxID=38151 RepID=A0A1B6DWR9_9HEMI